VFPRDPSEPKFITWVRNPGVRRTLILAFLWLFIAAALVRFSEVLLPFGLAVLIAFIIEPAVTWVNARPILGWRMPRVVVVLSIYALFISGAAIFASLALPEIGREIGRIGAEVGIALGDIDRYTAIGVSYLSDLALEYHVPLDKEDVERFINENTATVLDAARSNATHVFSFGSRVITAIVAAIFGSFLVLMLTAFLSSDAERIQRFTASLIPPEYLWSYTDIVRGITVGLAGVVRGQVMICLTNGLLTFVGLWLLKVKFPFVMALLATVFSLIPIFGSIISSIPIVLVALTDSFAKAIFALLWIIGIHLVEANLLNPKIMGNAAKIHPVVVVFALIAGERTGGLIGALFAVPIASVLMAFFKFFQGRALHAGQVADGTARASLPAPPLFVNTSSLPPTPPISGAPPPAGAPPHTP